MFVVLIGLLAILSRAAAVTTQAPWFSPAVSLDVYSVTLIGSVLVALVLIALASIRAAHLEGMLLTVSLRFGILSRITGSDPRIEEAPASPNSGMTTGVEDLFDRAMDNDDVDVVARRAGHDTLIEVSRMRTEARSGIAAIQRELVARHRAIQLARDHVWTSVAGPLLTSLTFLGIAASMLPGSGGFAQTNFQLNTMLVLFCSYGWSLLLAWATYAVVTLPNTNRKRKVFRPRLWEAVE